MVCHNLSQDAVARATEDLKLPQIEPPLVKPDHPMDVDMDVVAVAVLVKRVCSVQGEEGGERGILEVVE